MNIIEIHCSDAGLDNIAMRVKTESAMSVALFNGPLQVTSREQCCRFCEKARKRWPGIKNIGVFAKKCKPDCDSVLTTVAVSSSEQRVSLRALHFIIEAFSVRPNVATPADQLGSDSGKSDDEVASVPAHLIQVQANTTEINRRINAFMERKRKQVNSSNIRDFCVSRDQNETCARVDAVLVRKKDSTSHLTVRRVLNAYGPQTSEHYSECQNMIKVKDLPSVSDANDSLSSDTTDIDDSNQSSDPPSSRSEHAASNATLKKRKFSPADLEMKLNQLQQRLGMK